MVTWEEMAFEYRREIEALHKDMDTAWVELEGCTPKSAMRALRILEKSLDLSEENVRILSYVEPTEIKPVEPKKEKDVDREDCFKWLRSNGKDR